MSHFQQWYPQPVPFLSCCACSVTPIMVMLWSGTQPWIWAQYLDGTVPANLGLVGIYALFFFFPRYFNLVILQRTHLLYLDGCKHCSAVSMEGARIIPLSFSRHYPDKGAMGLAVYTIKITLFVQVSSRRGRDRFCVLAKQGLKSISSSSKST